jgi:hypothetical protein
MFPLESLHLTSELQEIAKLLKEGSTKQEINSRLRRAFDQLCVDSASHTPDNQSPHPPGTPTDLGKRARSPNPSPPGSPTKKSHILTDCSHPPLIPLNWKPEEHNGAQSVTHTDSGIVTVMSVGRDKPGNTFH